MPLSIELLKVLFQPFASSRSYHRQVHNAHIILLELFISFELESEVEWSLLIILSDINFELFSYLFLFFLQDLPFKQCLMPLRTFLSILEQPFLSFLKLKTDEKLIKHVKSKS